MGVQTQGGNSHRLIAVPVLVGRFWVPGLVDTGAERNLISRETRELQILCKQIESSKLVNRKIAFGMAVNEMDIDEEISLSMRLGLSMPTETVIFDVVDGLDCPLLLGMGAIRQFELTMCFLRDTMEIRTGGGGLVTLMAVTEIPVSVNFSVTVDPHATTLVSSDAFAHKKGECYMTTAVLVEGLSVAVTGRGSNTSMELSLTNTTDRPIEVRDSELLAILRPRYVVTLKDAICRVALVNDALGEFAAHYLLEEQMTPVRNPFVFTCTAWKDALPSSNGGDDEFAAKLDSLKGGWCVGQSEAVREKLVSLVWKYREVFESKLKQPGLVSDGARAVEHAITLNPGARPIKCRMRRYSPAEYDALDAHIEEMLAARVIRPSDSEWAFHPVFVTKADGTLRFCVNYKPLNAITRKDSYPIPRMEDAIDTLKGAPVRSVMDLTSGYWQIRMAQDSAQYTAFITPRGLFEFVVMPFGLTNAPATFQRFMDSVFQEFSRKFVTVYFDDVIVYSGTPEEHLQHLERVFGVLKRFNLRVKLEKCKFMAEEIKFLGYLFRGDVVMPNPDRVAAITEMPPPLTIPSLRIFFGYVWDVP